MTARRLTVCLAVIGAVLAVVLANAHLVYVATGSQPDCVSHARPGEVAGGYGAAQPSC